MSKWKKIIICIICKIELCNLIVYICVMVGKDCINVQGNASSSYWDIFLNEVVRKTFHQNVLVRKDRNLNYMQDSNSTVVMVKKGCIKFQRKTFGSNSAVVKYMCLHVKPLPRRDDDADATGSTISPVVSE